MPRYFFHVIDGSAGRDEDGTELASIKVAKAEAIRLSGEILRDLGAHVWDDTEWRMEVADAQGDVLFVLHFWAEERLTQSGARLELTFRPSPNEG